MGNNITTIQIQIQTRDLLKKLARKDQTYDSFLLELLQLKQKQGEQN